MIKIKSVTIEGMHNVDKRTYTFRDVNYLYGNNGAGKSTVLQAIQLALLGYIPGMNKTKESIFSNSNSHTMAVTLNLVKDSEVITVQRIWNNAGKSVNSVINTTPENIDIATIVKDLEIPIFNFNDFIGMTSNKLKDWFIGFLPSANSEIDWEKQLTESTKSINIVDSSLIPHWVTTLASYGCNGVDQVRKANEAFKQDLSFKKSELQRVENTIQSLVFYDDCDTDLTEDDIKSEISALDKEKCDLIRQVSIQDQNIKIKERNAMIYAELSKLNLSADCAENDSIYVAAKAQIDTNKRRIEDCMSRMNKHSIELTKLTDRRNELVAKQKLGQKMIESGGICQYTNSKCDSILDMIEAIKSEIAEIDKEIAEISKSIEDTNNEISELTSTVAEYRQLNNELSISMTKIEHNYDTRNRLQNQIETVDDAGCYLTKEDMTARIAEITITSENLTEMLAKLSANKKYEELTEMLAKQKFEIEQTIQALKIWINLTSANGLQSQMMNEPFIRFVDQLNKYVKPFFGEAVSAKFNLVEKANSFSFGIERNDKYISYDLLSSGEKCMFMLSMMICIVCESKSELNLILVDDLFDHLDDENVNKLIASLYSVEDVQFIIAGVKKIEDNECLMEVK